jgi:ABC-type lipoprotein export system ATPase subunit
MPVCIIPACLPLPVSHCQYPTAVSHCALQMGPSGSGKTTLLDLLAGRKTVGDVQGSIRFAGHKPSRQFLRRYTGYVEQFGEWPL